MVYCDPEELKWMPYVKTWMTEHMKRLKEETKEYIMDLFERYVEQGLLFVNKKCVQAMPQVRNKIYVSYTVLGWYVRGDIQIHWLQPLYSATSCSQHI